jgi:hypothetical protein
MAIDTGRGHARTRRLGALEVSTAFALFGTLLAATLPTLSRDISASRLTEPIAGLQRLSAAAVAYGQGRAVAQAFPPNAPPTPTRPPRGHCEADPPELWEHPTWKALEFLPVELGAPHCFSFAFESTLSPSRSTFRADAHGDLDGDGLTSTFEVTGQSVDGDSRGPVADPGMFIDSEVE